MLEETLHTDLVLTFTLLSVHHLSSFLPYLVACHSQGDFP